MRLSKNDYYEIEALMSHEGGFVEYEKDGETLCFDYDVDVEGYTEDDFNCGYGNGTGAFIPTGATVRISNVACYNAYGENVSCDFDENEMAKMYECELMSY